MPKITFTINSFFKADESPYPVKYLNFIQAGYSIPVIQKPSFIGPRVGDIMPCYLVTRNGIDFVSPPNLTDFFIEKWDYIDFGPYLWAPAQLRYNISSNDYNGNQGFMRNVIDGEVSQRFSFYDANGYSDSPLVPLVCAFSAATINGRWCLYAALCSLGESGKITRYRFNTPVLSYSGNPAPLDEIFTLTDTPDYNFPSTDPYAPGGESGETPSDIPPGTFDKTSDPIPDSSIPTLSAANTGFTRIYNPTLQQVQDLAKYLWTDDTVIETIWNHIKQYFEDPMQAIIGFNLVPVPVPDGGQQNFALMYIDTGVTMTVAGSQFVDVDCGTLALERYYGSALDQAPYTRITCFLPYIGQVDLDTDEVMGTTLQIKYRVDIVTGSCVAKIFVDGNCLYQYSGHCAINIPISSADFSSYVSAAISIAKLAGTAALAGSGVLPPPSPISTIQQTSNTSTTTTKDTSRNPATGRQITTGTRTISQDYNDKVETITTRASYDGLTPQNVTNTVGQIMGSKPAIQHSGSFSGNSGYLGVRRPYLIIQRPNMCLPENYQQLNGYPSMITLSLGSCKGYTQVQQVQLIGIPATNPEQAEILSLLKGGVIL